MLWEDGKQTQRKSQFCNLTLNREVFLNILVIGIEVNGSDIDLYHGGDKHRLQ